MRDKVVKYIVAFSCLLVGIYTVSAAPVITTFSPQSGSTGTAGNTTVTITGTGFSATPANNIVYFGGVQATVTAATTTQLTVTAPAGATWQPISVTVGGLTAYSYSVANPFIPTFAGKGYIAGNDFAMRVDFVTGTKPLSIAIGDLDGDGKPDLAVANQTFNTVSVLRNTSTTGSITTGSFASNVDFATGTMPVSLAIGDLDGDGKSDLAVVNYTSNTVSVLRNTVVSGSITTASFAAKVDFTTGTNPYSIAIGDLDRDGKSDIAVVNYGDNTVSVLQNTTVSGSITAGSFASKVDFATGGGAHAVAIADLDGDGKPDLAVANYGSNTVSVLRNTSTAGSISTGSFASKVDFATGTVPCFIAIGDLDGDGKSDLVVTNYSSSTISILRNTSTSGSITAGSFAAKVDFSTGTAPWGLSIGDLDGDGKPDIVTANRNSNTISILRNTSTSGSITSGSFASKVDFGTGTDPVFAIIGDLDGDGKSDLAVSNYGSNTVSVLGNGMMLTVTGFTPQSGATGAAGNTTVTITGTNFSATPANNIVYFGGVQATVTAATTTQLTVTAPAGATWQPISVTVGGLTAYSYSAVNPFIPTFAGKGSITATDFALRVDFTVGANPRSVSIGDLDGDGKLDLAVANYGSNTVSVFRNTSTSGTITGGSFASKVDFTTGTNPRYVAIGDLDGDGKLDLAVANQGSNTVSVFRNTSTIGAITTGSFAAKVDFATGTSPTCVAIGDLDGDGKSDLVTSNFNGNTVSLLLNTSINGSITTGSFATAVDITTGTSPNSVAIGDLDGDGKPDLAVTNSGAATVSVFRNTSISGSFTTGSFAPKVDFTTGTSPSGVTIGDLDGDGKPDIAVANNGSNTVSVFRNTSINGNITTGSFASKVDFTTGTTPWGVTIGDLDGDGKPEIVVANRTSNTVSVFRNIATMGSITSGSFASKVDFATGSGPYGVLIGDLDGDGKADMAVANENSNTISVLGNGMMLTVTGFTPKSGATGAAGNTTVTITGTNFSTTPANNIVYFGGVQATVTAATSTQLTVTAPAGATWQPLSVTVGGLTAYSYSVANPFIPTFAGKGSITATDFALRVDFTAGTSPFGVVIGDLDGDGKPDLVISNQNSNTVSVFRNTSTVGSITAGSFAAKVDFTTGTGPGFIAIGDLDGDGKPDLVVTNQNSNTVSVFRNTATIGTITTGSFAAKVDFAVGTLPIFMAIGDLDGDGKPDLVVSNYNSNTVSILRNMATIGSITTGSFATKVDFTTGSNPAGVAIGDLDGDGKPDLAVSNQASNTVSVFRNTAAVGSINTGSFASKVDFTTGTGPVGVAIGDLDGDGKSDLAVANDISNSVSLFRNTSVSGSITTGSFAAKVDFSPGSVAYGVAIGDLDGDGKPDLAVANAGSNTVSVFRNTATSGSITTGSFATKIDFSVGTNPYEVAIGDLDGDGKADLAVSNGASNTVSVLGNGLLFTITGFSPQSGPTGAAGNTTVTITGSGFSATPANNIVYFGAVQATVTAATNYQLTVTAPAGATWQPISVTVGGRTAYSYSVVNPFIPTFAGKAAIVASDFAAKVDFGTGTTPWGVSIGDLDGDGKPDLVATNYGTTTISVFRNTSITGSIAAGSFSAKVDFTTGTYPRGIAIGDLDGDGKPDLAVVNQTSTTVSVFRNTSVSGSINSASFAPKVDFTTGSVPTVVVIGDLDGDGKPDLAVNNYNDNTVSVFRNTSTPGVITAASFAAKVDFATGITPNFVAIGDLDGDGKPDLITTNNAPATVSVLRNTTTVGSITSGSFSTKVDFTSGTSPLGVAIGDLDGDGKPDLAVSNYGASTLSLLRNTATVGSITTASFVAKVDFTTGTNPIFTTIGDLDGDGKPDLAVANAGSSTVSLFRNMSATGSITTNSFAPKVDLITGTTPTGLAIGDLDGDGKADLVTSNSGSNTVSIFANTMIPFTVTGFSPASGPTGVAGSTTVTITGSGFSTTLANNVVYFGAVPATVTAATTTQLTVTAPAGATWQPVSVTVGGLTAYSYSVVNPFIPTFAGKGYIADNDFALKIDFTTGTQPYVLAIGDLDGDGKPDLVVSNQSSNTVSVFRNTSTLGTLTASSFAGKVDFTTGTTPIGSVIADFDGDGKPDLAVANSGSNTVSIFRNTSTVGSITTGSFSAKVDFTTGTTPNLLAVGDLDGDGKPDLAVANNGSNTVSIFRNISTTGSINAGSFAAKVDFTTGTGTWRVSIGDLDGDGKPDLAVANMGSNTVSVFRNTASTGSITAGSFAAKVDFTTGTSPYGVAIGDLDGDGKADLVVTNNSAATISVFRNTATVGAITTGSFAAKVDFTVGTTPNGIAIGDLDGDGKPDLAVSNYTSNTVSILRNTSMSGSITSGSFAAKIDYGTGVGLASVGICDLDGDGKADLVVANRTSNTISILGNGMMLTVTGFSPQSGATGAAGSTTVTITGTNFSTTLANNIVYFGAVKATVTAATPTQLTVTAPSGATWQPLSVTVGGLTAYSYSVVNPFISTFTGKGYIADNDFALKIDFTTGTTPWSVAIGDLDGDGKPDLVVTNVNANTISVFRNISITGAINTGSFASKVDFATGTTPRGAAIGDLDGDGKPDLAVANNGSNTVSVFRNISTSGSITTGSFATKVDFTTGSNPFGLAIGDLDGDGKPDLVVCNPGSNTVSVFKNTATSGSITTGSFAAKVDFTTGTYPYDVAIKDMDGDGKPDMVVSNYNVNTLSVFRNTTTNGSITASSFASKIDFATGTAPCCIFTGDLDGDGKPDLAVSNYTSNTVSVFRNTTTSGSITSGSFATKVDFPVGTQPVSVAIGDLDGDGKPDLVVGNYGSNTISVFRNIATSGSITAGSFASKIDFGTGNSPCILSIGDLDGDGKPDLAVVNQASNTISVLGNGMMLTVTGFSPQSGATGAAGSTTVTITGTNFSATPANNIVYFGAVQATVAAATPTQLTVTAPSGAIWQPVSVTVGGFTAYSYSVVNPFIPTFTGKGYIADNDFALKIDFTTGTQPYVLAIGDLDGDGKPDLAVANYGSNTVSVFRNTSTMGTLTASSFAGKVDFTTGTTPIGLVIADFDGDGKPDLAVANSGSNTVSIFRNTSAVGSITTGSFAAKVDFTTGTTPNLLAVGDLDGDGKPDLVVSNQASNTVSVFKNTATMGSITTASFAAKVDFATGTTPWRVSIGDLDGDGKPDLAVANFGSNTVSVFRNISSRGSITTASFAAKVDFTTGTSPYGVAIGDLDGDGKADLVVTNNSAATISVFRNTATVGSITTGSFAAKVDFTVGTTPNGIAIGDLDGDGKPDLAVSNYTSNTVSILRNTSTSGTINAGSFASKIDYGTGVGLVSVGISDLDGDGKADLAVSNYGSNTISILGNGMMLTVTGFSPQSGATGAAGSTTVTITGTNFSTTLANNIVYFGAVQATVTAATTTQLTVTAPSGATWQPVSVTVGGFTAYSYSVVNPFIPTFAGKGSITATDFALRVDFTSGTNPRSVAIGDLDGDGKPDLVVSSYGSNTVSVFRNTSTSSSITAGSFASKVDFTTGSNPYWVTIGDLDGDGKPDLAVTNFNASTISVFRNTSTSGSITTGSFAAKVDFTTGTNPVFVAIGDLNGDGKPELTVTNYNSATVSVFRNTSTSGSITTGSFATKVDFTTGSNPYGMAIGDLDGDGKPDMAVINYGSNTVSLFRNTSTIGAITTGSFASKVDFATGSGPYGVLIGDLDGDGKPELTVTNQSSSTVSVLRNTATSGSITTGSFASKVDFTTGSSPCFGAIGDLDGDGKPDLAVVNNGAGTVSVLRNTSTTGSITTGSFATKVDFTTGTAPWNVAIGDLDGDGKPDLAVANYNSASVSVLGNGLLFVVNSFSPASGPTGAAGNTTVTITGVGFSATPANNIVYFGGVQATVTAATTTQLTVTAPAGATWQPISVTVGGRTAYSYSVANPFIPTFAGKGSITATDFALRVDFTTGTNPLFVAIGDLDGDGKPDLVVPNHVSNTVSVFRNTSIIGSITAGSFAAKVDFTTGAGPYFLAIGDLDGDGKPDLAVANLNSSTVSVLRNTSASGSITAGSFAAKVDFTTSTSPICVSIGDLDGDGKPDLAATCYASGTVGAVSVFRNTSTSGSLTAGSFAAKVDFTTGAYPFGMAIGDLDGDGKPDLAVANSGSNTVSLFRNTSVIGSITTGSFAAKVDFTTGVYPAYVSIGDLDGDGKSDMVVTNLTSSTVSVFRNTSTIGSITTGSFAGKVDFTTGSSPCFGVIGDLDGDGKPDLVVPNSGASTVSVFRNISTSGSITTGSFAPKIDFATGSAPYGVAIGDLDGDGKADMAVANQSSNTVSVLGNGLLFTITGFSPQSGPTGAAGNTTVTITGSGFSATPANNTVYFGAVQATVTAATNYQLTVAAPAGATWQPISVTVGGRTAYSYSVVNPFIPTFAGKGAITAADFNTKVDLSAGNGTFYTAIGDLDGDGKPDLIALNLSDGTVSVFRNTSTAGAITSGSFAPKVDFTVGSAPRSVDIGDLDGDGKLDLVVTNYGSNTVSVLRNTATSGSINAGSFATKVDFTTGANPYSAAVGDLDGDGKPDLAVVNYGTNTVSVFRNIATMGSITSGSFAAKVDFTTGGASHNIAIGDLDGDGKPDMAVTNTGSPSVSIFRNIATMGSITSGSFATKVDFTVGSNPYTVTIGDLDGDGKPDLAVINNGSNTISVLRNTATAGSITTGSFAAKVDFATGTQPMYLCVGDLNGDRKPDLAVSNQGANTISVLCNLSTSGSITTGSFASKVDFAAGTNPTGLVIGDLDGDGQVDLAVANYGSNTVSVFANTMIPFTVTSFSPASGATGAAGSTTVTITGSGFSTTPANNIVYFGAVPATVTAATTTQLTVTAPAGATWQPISVTVGGLTAYSYSVVNPFIPTFAGKGYISGNDFALKVDFAVGTNPWGVAIGDLDGDGKPDLAVSNAGSNTISVFRNTSILGTLTSGSFAAKVDFTTGTAPRELAIGDLDGDGKPDLVVVNLSSNTISLFRNTAVSGSITTASFASKVDLTTGSGPTGIAIGDLDGDGKPDLAVSNYNDNTISIFRNISTQGVLTSASFTAKVDFVTGTTPNFLAIGDLDGDGKPDILTTNNTPSTVSVLRNTTIVGSITSGSFAAKVDFPAGTGPLGVAIGDLDGDGKPDLAVSNYYAATLSLFRNTSTMGSITMGSFASKVDFVTGTSPIHIAIDDLDGDGKPDLIVAIQSANTVSVFRNIATAGNLTASSFAPKIDFGTGVQPICVAIGDLDGDGKADLAVSNYGSNTVSVLGNSMMLTVTGFSPQSGATGAAGNTTVTITGTNFSATPANNIVYFGAVKATVTAATTTQLTVTAPAGATWQPISVTVGGLTAYSYSVANPFIPTFAGKGYIADKDFALKIDFTPGTQPYGLAIGDLDGDGKPDLAVANYGSNTVSVFRNTSTTGTLTSSSFAGKVDFTAGTNPMGLVIRDLDGDGKLDMVVSNQGSNTVSVFRNTSTIGAITTGSFAAKVDFATGNYPCILAVGDLDGDGKPDLAVPNNNSSTVSVLRNTSTSGSITTGSFATKVDFTTGTNPNFVTIGDLDGDGKPDLAVANGGSNTVSVFRNTATAGSITTGSFAAKVDFTVGTNPYGVAIGDLDGDGKPDLIVSNNNSATISLFRNTTTLGSITTASFAAKVDFAVGTTPNSIAIGDLDGDGKPDLAISNYTSNTVSVLRNTSTSGTINAGSFAAKIDYGTGVGLASVVIGDLDGDGKPDLAVSNYGSNTVSVLGNGMMLTVTGFTPQSGVTGAAGSTTVTITGTNFSTTPANNIVYFGAVKATVTAATTTQLTVTAPAGATWQPISVTVGGLTAYSYSVANPFIPTFAGKGYIADNDFAMRVDFAASSNTIGVVIGDLDGDGKPDLVASNYGSNTISVFRNTSSSGSITAGSFAAKVDFATGTNPCILAMGDIDRDGKPDLVVANYVANTVSILRNTATSGNINASSFATKVDFTTGTNPYGVAIGDLDGDGKPDLVVSNQSSNTVSVFQNTSTSGSITTGSFAAKVDFATGTQPVCVAIGDLDGDKKPDLVVANSASNSVSVFRNTASSGIITTGSFASKIDFTAGTTPWGVAIGDLDLDGKADLVVSNQTSNTLSVFRNTASVGSITTGSFASKIDFTTGTGPKGIAIGDLDGDGKPDLAVANSGSNTISLLRNMATIGSITASSFASNIDFGTGSGPCILAIGDLDGDGKPDLAVVNQASNMVSVFGNGMMLTVTGFTPKSGSTGAAGSTTITITGTNFSTTPANNIVYFGAVKATVTAATTTQLTVTAPAGAIWQPISVTVGGLTAYSYSVANPFIPTFAGKGYIADNDFALKIDFTTGTGPQSVAMGDLDGDGKPDLAVVNYGSNTVSVFRNTSTSGSITSGSFATKVDFVTGTGPYGVEIGDLDGDGKLDLIVSNYGSNTISVFRNTATSGSITSGSFGTKVDFTTGSNPCIMAIGDLDGNGKPDLVVANYTSNTVSVFQNISTSGSITSGSFATKVDFATGTSPWDVAINDLDGDGKPDMAVANNVSGTISVFRNTTSTGSITTGSFAAKVDFVTGSRPNYLTTGDLDGDSKIDMIVASYNSAIVSVFRNTATAGFITAGSFATRVDFATGTGPYGVAIGDLDGDSKPDIVVTNFNSNTVSVFRNTSTSGSITAGSFAPKIDFGTGVQPVCVAIGDLDGDGKADLVMSNSGSNSISVLGNGMMLTVTGFTPQSGVTGAAGSTTVTITGTNFSTTPANNIVYFGAVKATVSAATPTQLTVTAPAGATWQPISVTVGGFTAYSYPVANPFIPTFAGKGYIADNDFALKVDFATTAQPYRIVVGDVDGDGKPDLVVSYSVSNTVSVFRNTSTTGTITSGSFAANVDFIVGAGLHSVAIGDLDGDGKPDLAVANGSSNTISVLRNTSTIGTITAGSFAAKVDFATGTTPWALVIGDLDANGKPDLIVSNNGSNTVSVLSNTATSGSITSGSFASKVDFSTGTQPLYVAIGDLDGDGKPDIVVANYTSNTVSVLRNITPIGSINAGSFASKVDFVAGLNPVGVALVDLDGDGKLDITVANQGSNTVSVFRNTATSGSITTGSFATKVDFAAGTASGGLGIGDLDGDGKPDLVSVNQGSNTVSVLRNIATSGSITTGSFAPKIDFGTGVQPVCVAIGDLDGDGKADLAVVNNGSNTVSVLGNGMMLTVTGFTPKSGATGTEGTTTVTIIGTNFSTTPANNIVYFGAVKATVGAATTTQLTVTAPAGATWQPISVTVGGFTAYSYPVANPFIPTFAGKGYIAVTDFALKVNFTAGVQPFGVAIGDLDGDGKPDLVVSNYGSNTVSVFRNASASGTINQNSFVAKVDFATGSGPYVVAIGDLDGDGKPDLAIANYSSNTISVLRNTSASGSITTASFATKVDFTTGTAPVFVAIGDLDGDGKPDLVAPNFSSNTVSVLRNTSTVGSITATSFGAKIDFTTGTNPWGVAIGDLDGDGKPDLVVTNALSATVSVFRNITNAGSITTGSFTAKVDFTTGTTPYAITIGDLDGDGKSDMIVTNYNSNTVSVFRNTSAIGSITVSSFAAKVDLITGSSPVGVAIGDLDGDGKPDMAVSNYSANTVSVFRNIATSGSITTGSFAPKIDFATGSIPCLVSIGDLDGNGKADMAVANYGSNTVSVLTLAPKGTVLFFSIP